MTKPTSKKRRATAKRNITIAFLVMVIVFAGMDSALAYTTESFDVDVEVGEDNSYTFTETITVNFDGLQHGISRSIPVNGSDHLTAMQIDNINVVGWQYENYVENKCSVIQIGDTDTFLNGRQIFTIEYRVRVYDNKEDKDDMMYIDVLPDNWDTDIGEACIHLRLPKEIDESDFRIYAAGYGADESLQYVSWDYDADNMEITIQGEDLPQGMGITVYCPLPEGYWVNQLSSNWAYPLSLGIAIAVPLVICLLWLVCMRRGRVSSGTGLRMLQWASTIVLSLLAFGICVLMSVYVHSIPWISIRDIAVLAGVFCGQVLLIAGPFKARGRGRKVQLAARCVGMVLVIASCGLGGYFIFKKGKDVILGIVLVVMMLLAVYVSNKIPDRIKDKN